MFFLQQSQKSPLFFQKVAMFSQQYFVLLLELLQQDNQISGPAEQLQSINLSLLATAEIHQRLTIQP